MFTVVISFIIISFLRRVVYDSLPCNIGTKLRKTGIIGSVKISDFLYAVSTFVV